MLAAFLVVAGNAASFLQPEGLPGSGLARFLFGIALGGFVALWTWRAGYTRAALGRGGRVAGLGVVMGAVLGAAAGVAGVALLEHPLVVAQPITYAPLAGMPAPALAVQVLFSLPIAVVVPEELAFRGALLAALEHGARARAVAISAFAFALWHTGIIAPTLRATNLADPILVALALAGAAVVLFAGGVALALLRLRTRTLATTIAAHWSFNATLLVGLWLLATPR